MGAPVWASKPSELCARWRPSPHRWTCNSQCLRARSFVSILPTFTRSRCTGLSFQASLSTWLFQPASEMGGGADQKTPKCSHIYITNFHILCIKVLIPTLPNLETVFRSTSDNSNSPFKSGHLLQCIFQLKKKKKARTSID